MAALFVIESFSSLLLPLSVNLQSPELDILQGLDLIESVTAVLQERRVSAEANFAELYEEICSVCSAVDIDMRLRQRCNVQVHRENHPSETPEDYFRVSIYTQYLDQLITEMNSLFADARKEAFKIQHLVPRFVENSQLSDLKYALDFYQNDLACSSSSVKAEYERWKLKWLRIPHEDRPRSAIEALNECSDTDYPKISILLQIFATLPVTSSTPERTFSVLKLLKTYLRSTRGEDRLNGLTSMKIHREVSISADEVLDAPAANSRKIDMVL